MQIKNHLQLASDHSTSTFYESSTGVTTKRISAKFKDFEGQSQSGYNLLDNRQKIMITENEQTFQSGQNGQSCDEMKNNHLPELPAGTLNISKLELCSGLIVSPIIVKQNNNNTVNIKEALIYIFEKYIGPHAMYPISMSYQNEIIIKRILFGNYEESEEHEINYDNLAADLVNPGTPKDPHNILTVSSYDRNMPKPIQTISPLPSDHETEVEMEQVGIIHEDGNEDEKTRIVVDGEDNEYDDETLMSVFDCVAIEHLYCLHDSFLRFQSSRSYVEYSKINTPNIIVEDDEND